MHPWRESCIRLAGRAFMRAMLFQSRSACVALVVAEEP
jgi:hypothetical protein